ncbi:MAG: SMI1/KNR4 family protein [Rivularia sp. (in: Bacteria)]|nr:SMI1/KNR4 family protein [Rivularia sp. MS3]
MSELIHALNRIVNWLKNHPSEKYASVDVLQPGLSYEEIDRRVADLPFKLPKEVYELYQWRNGTCEGEEERARFFNGLFFLSLEAALDKYEELLEEFEDFIEDDYLVESKDYSEKSDFWDVMWFPLFCSIFIDEPSFYLVKGDSEGNIYPDIFYSNPYDYHCKEFNSLAEMMLLIAKSYESKADLQVNKPTAKYFYQMSSSRNLTNLNNAFDRILIYLEEHENLNNARFESLKFGLSYEEIIEKIKDLPLCFPTEVIELYRWGNGTWKGEELYGRFFNNYTFLSLEAALEIYNLYATSWLESRYRTNLPYLNDDNLRWRNLRWNKRWFPIMEDLDGKGLLVIVLNQQQIETSPILDIFWEDIDGEPDIIYPNLTKMIQAEAELYEAGYYLPRKNREIDYEAVKCIRQKYQEIPMRVWRE